MLELKYTKNSTDPEYAQRLKERSLQFLRITDPKTYKKKSGEMNMSKIKKQVVVPDLTGYEVIKDMDIIDLVDFVTKKIIEQLGEAPIYAVEKYSYSTKYKVIEIDPSTLKIGGVSDSDERRILFEAKPDKKERGWYSEPMFLCRNKNKAEEYCKEKNLEYYKEEILNVQKEIDEFNIVKVREEAEKKQAELVQEYEKIKGLIAEIEGKEGQE